MNLEKILGGDEPVSVYDSRLLFFPIKKKLLVALGTTIISEGVDPGVVILFDNVQHYSLCSLDDTELTEQNKKELKNGVIFRVKDAFLPLRKSNNYLLKAFPFSIVSVYASSYKILDTHFRLR